MPDEAEFSAPISREIWDLKYRLKSTDGGKADSSLDDTFWRVARAAATAEKGGKKAREKWAKRFHGAMSDLGFLPAGRILAGAGTGRSVTLFNCFVLGTIDDDLSAIFANVKDAALTMQQGGGIGHDFSTLRPKGAPVASIGADASGPVSFMEVWDAMCRTIMSAGSRRGAMMAHLALRPPRHRSLHRSQVGARAAAKFQSVGARHRRLPRRRAGRLSVGPEVRRQGLPHRAGARPVGAHHARNLRLRRAGGRLHRPYQCPQQPQLLRTDPRHQPLWRTAVAAVWRLPAWLDQPGTIDRASVHQRRHPRPGQARRAGQSGRALPRQCHRHFKLPARGPTPGSAGQAAHRPWHHRTGRRAHLRRRPLRNAGGGAARR